MDLLNFDFGSSLEVDNLDSVVIKVPKLLEDKMKQFDPNFVLIEEQKVKLKKLLPFQIRLKRDKNYDLSLIS